MNNTALLSILAATLAVGPTAVNAVEANVDYFASGYGAGLRPAPTSGNEGRIAFDGRVVRGPTYTGIQPSALSRYAGIQDLDVKRASQLLTPGRTHALTLSYGWRRITIEGATASAPAESDTTRHAGAAWRPVSRSARLSYEPKPGLVFQFSRGTWSRLDQLVAEDGIKRTSLSASYTKRITGGEWQTTLAWGRNAPRAHKALYGYLVETSLRVAGSHLTFARLEQVGGGRLTETEVPPAFLPERLRKASVGYYQDLMRSRGARVGVGLMASRHLVPATHAAAFGKNPTSFVLFMRVNTH